MLNIYSILDKKSNLYTGIFQSDTDANASRQFARLSNDKQSNIGLYPEDFALCKVGSLNQETGFLIPIEPQILAQATAYVKDNNEQLINS